MVTIRLFCAAGMSTSLLVNKMKESATKRGIEADIAAFPEGQMDKHLDGVNVALLGPQVGYRLANAKALCGPKGIPVEVINMMDYGRCNGKAVLERALELKK